MKGSRRMAKEGKGKEEGKEKLGNGKKGEEEKRSKRRRSKRRKEGSGRGREMNEGKWENDKERKGRDRKA